MGCIIALNVDSLVAAVVGRLVQPRVPDCINDSRNTYARNAETPSVSLVRNNGKNVVNAK